VTPTYHFPSEIKKVSVSDTTLSVTAVTAQGQSCNKHNLLFTYKSITFHILPLHPGFPAADLIHRTPKDIKQIYSVQFPVHMVAIAVK
jgi:hypothetical protein